MPKAKKHQLGQIDDDGYFIHVKYKKWNQTDFAMRNVTPPRDSPNESLPLNFSDYCVSMVHLCSTFCECTYPNVYLYD